MTQSAPRWAAAFACLCGSLLVVACDRSSPSPAENPTPPNVGPDPLRPLLKANAEIDAALEELDAVVDRSPEGEITSIDLQGVPVTDESIAGLHRLTALHAVNLSHTQISDTGLQYLPPSVRILELYDTQISDRGLRHLQDHDLAVLALSDTRVTDTGLEYLSGMRELTTLALSNTAVTDAGMEAVSRFPSLTALIVEGTALTDDGLARLNTLDQLEGLYVTDTQVTPAGIARLQKELPRLNRVVGP